MVRNLLACVAVCLTPVAVFWFAGRLLGLDRPVSGPTGRAWLDAEDAFDRGADNSSAITLRLRCMGSRIGLTYRR